MSIPFDNLRETLKQKDAHIIRLQHDLSSALQEVHWANLRIRQLEEKLRQERIARFGPRSEKLSDLQLSLLEEEPSVTADEVSAESEREAAPAEPVTPPVGEQPRRERQSHPGRQKLPASLPRKEEIIACPPAACNCKSCGRETAVIGYDESEQLDVEPAQYFVRVIKREKRACRHCEKRTVVAAPLPDRILEKSIASDRILVETVIRKYCDHLPLYRQEAILRRDTGMDISRVTLDGWVMHIGELLQPITKAMRLDLLRGTYLQADETTAMVRVEDKRGSLHEGYIWQFGRPGGEVVFEFALGRGRDVVARFLGQWEGKLQTDGYVSYDKVGGPKVTRYGCWAHARRYFIDAVKVNNEDGGALKMVTCMDALFLVERQAKELGLAGEEKLAYRRKHGQEWLDALHKDAEWLRPRTLPKSKLGEGLTYLANQWDRLKRSFEDPEVELSNNLAENSMRPWALGRKNWLQVGSVSAGPKVVAIASVVESCRRLQIPVREYMLSVLPGLADRTTTQVAGLTPARWAAGRK